MYKITFHIYNVFIVRHHYVSYYAFNLTAFRNDIAAFSVRH